MGERKPSCHYIAPDFDPSQTGRRCKPQNGQHTIRFMLPMAIKCTNCGEYMHAGTKANARKELCYTDAYLGEINVYRIYIHCKACYAEITIKTDPEHCDYIVEKGATRHFEPWRDHYISIAMEEKNKLKGSIIEQAEAKTVDMKKEMEHIHELERLRAKSQKIDKMNLESVQYDENEKKQILTELDRQRIDLFELKKQEELHLLDKQELANQVYMSPQPTINTFKSKKVNMFDNAAAEDFGF
ncbi:cell cycle control protein, putative [Trichomonas vaginalis G3]|uniref:Cell cycle control protein, putative n=1 Tax=Trichomonas vaginalis (strain ATCC PRA-98 / G3) TaxID=412133 RepID=A2ECM7_TRIV3|nr:mRNA splicing, via spliceosome [Trichomonas vaginalis G3]EAY09624.1 cell cycle control protein, putative [Trichomonas vaginalis G3]KAI5502135.1 mRNA splicing, via spliceosome [Trichomonas vaginalis G3]|eukprot:XP_001321847.1 cell cycle control protein [Trichomonas vaginalis G3]